MVSLEALVIAAFLLILGIAFCFGGYKWFMILLPVLAFLVGSIIGAVAVSGVYGDSILSLIVIVVAGLIVGLSLAVLAYLFFNLGVILLGAAVGYTIGSGLAYYLGFVAGPISFVAGLIAAAVVAFLAFRLNLPKYIIIALTALIGSEAILSGILLLIGFITPSDLQLGLLGSMLSHSVAWTFVWLVLAAAGAAIQLHRAKLYELDLEASRAKGLRG
jgi:Domain of unknown function (DUF4203)